MYTMGPTFFILIAVMVFTLWRYLCIRRYGGGRPGREALVAVLFLYLLAMASIVLFPTDIVLYSWHGRVNVVPLASIIELVRGETWSVALTNILGNVLMFVPLGFLMPLLLPRLRSVGQLLWRGAAISLAIEALQYLTQARSTDVDDVMLNVTGAAVGFGLFRLLPALASRVPRVQALLDAAAGDGKREPLLSGLVPAGLTLLLTFTLVFLPKVIAATLDEQAIAEDVCAGMDHGAVVAEGEGGGYKILLAAEEQADHEVFCWGEYKRVLPGRYTRVAGPTEPTRADGSWYVAGCTLWTEGVDEGPVVYVLGRKTVDAHSLVATAAASARSVESTIGEYFVVVIPPQGTGADYAGVQVRFYDFEDKDVSQAFRTFDQAWPLRPDLGP